MCRVSNSKLTVTSPPPSSTTCLKCRWWNIVVISVAVATLSIVSQFKVECTNRMNVNSTDTDQDLQACMEATLDAHYMKHPDKFLQAPGIIERHGYPVEMHQVTSEDGYILELHRIPHGPVMGPGEGPKTPVLIQHGIMASSVNWILPPKEQALAYRISNMGYDVWLGNVRGSSYSLRHMGMDHMKDEYWQFSWHEMGYYDIPAIIDYVLDYTNHTRLTYIGHSMGCTMFFVCMSLRPEYNDKIETMFALAPVAYVGNASSFFKLFAPFSYNFNAFYNMVGRGQLIPEPLRTLINPFFASNCNMHYMMNCNICSNIYFMLFNSDGKQMNYTMLPVLVHHFPDRVSTKTVTHYGQNLVANTFQFYDERYALPNWVYQYFPYKRKPKPQRYDLTKITVPVVLFYADRDNLADPKDVSRLIKELPNVKAAVKVCYPFFNHNDFLFGINVNELVYDKLINILTGSWSIDYDCEDEYVNQIYQSPVPNLHPLIPDLKRLPKN